MKKFPWSTRRLPAGTLLAAILLLVGLAWAAGEIMSVQVRTGQLRARPSFLGAKVADVRYGAKVTVKDRRGPWVEVWDEAGHKGWLHESALSEKNLQMASGNVEAATGASGEEVALAGKGFNEQVENEYRKQNKDLDYAWVDRMETIVISAQQAEEFLNKGDIQPQEGGR